MTERWTGAALLKAQGKWLEYGCHGPPPAEAPTVVLLHEGLGSRDLWRDFPARLSAATGWGVKQRQLLAIVMLTYLQLIRHTRMLVRCV